MKKKFEKALSVIVVLGLGLSIAACTGGSGTPTLGNNNPQKKVVMKFAHVVSSDTPKGKAIELFKKEVETKSNGTMEVEVFPSSQLYGDADEIEALLANNVQFIAPSSTKVVQISPSFQIFDVPFLFSNENAVVKFWDDPKGGQAMLTQLDSKGLVGLGFLSSGFKQLFDGKKMIKSPGDIKGMKFRAAAGGILTEQFQALGASSVSIPFGEVYSALQQGTIDGSENSWPNIYTQKFFEVNPYITVSNHGRFDYSVITNKKFWSTLTPAQQTMIKEAIKVAQDFSVRATEEQEAKFIAEIKKNPKVQITELTPEQRQAFRTAVTVKYSDWEKKIGADLFKTAVNLGKQ